MGLERHLVALHSAFFVRLSEKWQNPVKILLPDILMRLSYKGRRKGKKKSSMTTDKFSMTFVRDPF